jgi:hypothetical protein
MDLVCDNDGAARLSVQFMWLRLGEVTGVDGGLEKSDMKEQDRQQN